MSFCEHHSLSLSPLVLHSWISCIQSVVFFVFMIDPPLFGASSREFGAIDFNSGYSGTYSNSWSYRLKKQRSSPSVRLLHAYHKITNKRASCTYFQSFKNGILKYLYLSVTNKYPYPCGILLAEALSFRDIAS